MKRKDYQKPTMNIVKLQHHCHILAGSVQASGQVNATMDNEWEEVDI